MQKIAIYRVYYILATLDLLTIIATMAIAYRINGIYHSSYQENETWLSRLDQYELVTNHIIHANGPGNNVFESLDEKTERANFRRISRMMQQDLEEIRSDASKHIGSSTLLTEGLDQVAELLRAGSDYTERIFDHVAAGDMNEAGKFMSRMDGKFHKALVEFSTLKIHLRSLQSKALQKQHQRAEELFKNELYLGGLVLLIITLIILYGRRLKRRMEEHENEIIKRTNELENLKFALDSHSIISRTDLRGRIVAANDLFCQISGYERSELIGKNQSIVNSGHHSREFFAMMWKDILRGKNWRALIKNRKKNGGFYWVDTTITPIKNEQGKVKEFLSIRSEVTEQVELQSLSDELQDIANIGGWAVHLDPMSIHWTDQTYRIHEVPVGTPLELEGAINYYAEHERERISSLVERCISHRESFDDEFELVTAKANTIWVRAKGRAEINKNAEVTRIIGTFQDITEKKKQQIELIHAKEKAEKSERSKAAFLANMSHEIRTPLNGVIGMLELLKETKLTEQQDKMLGTLDKSGHLLMTILNDVLDYSKIDSGNIRLDKRNFNLRQCIEESVQLMQHKAIENKNTIEFDLEKGQMDEYFGDEYRVKQIINNYLSNAIKFTHNGSVTIGFDLISENADSVRVKIYVKDNGIGISESAQSRLFNAYTQSDESTTRKYGGTGLGLSICEKLAHLMNGKTYFESQEGSGSTFYAELEFGKARLSEKHSEQVESVKLSEGPLEHNILLVEDNKTNQDIAAGILKVLGYSCDIAENGKEAIEQVSKKPIDHYTLILMDMQMPELDGIEATKRLVATYGVETPIIVALTANAFDKDRDRCFEAGMSDYVTKPIKKKIINTILHKFPPKAKS